MSRNTRNNTGSRSNASPRSYGHEHRLGDGHTADRAPRGSNSQARHAHHHQGRPLVQTTVSTRPISIDVLNGGIHLQCYGNPTGNSMRVLEQTMSNLNIGLDGAQQVSFGSGFPFNQGGHKLVPDISGLQISGSEDALSRLTIPRGHSVSHPESMLGSFIPVRHPSRRGTSFQHRIEHTPHPGFQPGNYLPFDDFLILPLGDWEELRSVPYDYFSEAFDSIFPAEDRGPTENDKRCIDRFIAHHTKPLTTANRSITTNTDCPICMEDATAHACVKIEGITGCKHMIGRSCLEELLRRQSDSEKTCPLCRAVWLPRRDGVLRDAAAQWDGPTGYQDEILAPVHRSRRDRGMERVRDIWRGARNQ